MRAPAFFIFFSMLLPVFVYGEDQLLSSFEKADELATMQPESVTLSISSDAGVTDGKSALKIVAKARADWASLVLPPDAIRGWEGAESVSIDVYCELEEKIPLNFELWDAQSKNMQTRFTNAGNEITKGKHTLRWDVTHARRNAKENSAWEALEESDKIQLAALTKVKFFVTPLKDHDLVFYFDNVRLAKKSAAAIEAEKREADEAKTRKVIFKTDFEDGTGLGGNGVKFVGNWRPLVEATKVVIEAPLGKGNDSKKALTCHSSAGATTVAMELPMHHTVVEPEGWDGIVSLRLYNGGFESFYMTYSPIYPSDVTFHRAEFTAAKNEWTEITMPLDKFLYFGRRPRRGCELEYICLVGVGPQNAESVFQFDDFKVTRIKRENAPAAKAKETLPAGVAYQQNFDDPNDFDLEGFYPVNNKSNAFRIDGGLGADGKPIESDKSKAAGCLKIEGYQKNAEFRGGRRGFNLSASGSIEFDCLLKGAADFALGARGKSANRLRIYPKSQPQPQPETWTHFVLNCADFGDGKAKMAESETIWEINFGASADASAEHYVLIDNLKITTGK